MFISDSMIEALNWVLVIQLRVGHCIITGNKKKICIYYKVCLILYVFAYYQRNMHNQTNTDYLNAEKWFKFFFIQIKVNIYSTYT